MNKLTEIKANYEKFKDEIVEEGLKLTALDRRLMQDLGHTLDLLEEKDKALTFYADGNHYTNEYLGLGRQEEKLIDRGEIARKALNTSSNNEGE